MFFQNTVYISCWGLFVHPSVIIEDLWWAGGLKSQYVEKCEFLCFLEKEPLWENFQNTVLEGFITSTVNVLCSNFMKFGRRKMDKIVDYLCDKKKFHPNWSTFGSYTQTHEHNQNRP